MRWYVGLFLLMLTASSNAHTRSESRSSWTIVGNSIHLVFSISEPEAARLSSDGARPSDDRLADYLGAKLGVDAGATPCPLRTAPQPVAATIGYRRLEMTFECRSAIGLKLIDHAMFDVVPTHVNLAQIQLGEEFSERVFQLSEQTIALDDSAHEIRSAGLLTFIRMGVMHIFTGVDHMSFLLGLVLISRRLRDLLFVVTGFTIGHSITLALAVTGIIRPHAEFIDALVALTIALIGAENVALASRRPGTVAAWTGALLLIMASLRFSGIGLLPPWMLVGAALFSASYLLVSGHLRDAGRLRLMVTLVFGLIHGFGFAADLLGSRLPPGKLAQILFGFNLGVEVGQLSVVTLLVGAASLLIKYRVALSRRLVVDVAASVLVSLGLFWFTSRSF